MINVVLYEPEIPANTGNIIRTCMASGSRLHLIEPLGFSFDDKYLRRSGMDYIKEADITIYPNWQDFLEKNPDADLYFMSRYGKKPHPSLISPIRITITTSFWARRARESTRPFSKRISIAACACR